MTRHNPYRHQLDRMADELIDKTIGTDAIELTRRWRANELATCDAVNTLFAVFGIASRQGRFGDNLSFLNPPYEMWLMMSRTTTALEP